MQETSYIYTIGSLQYIDIYVPVHSVQSMFLAFGWNTGTIYIHKTKTKPT